MKSQSETKHNILVTASRLFRLQGYHATGLNQIIKESGAPKGSLYYYFPGGKEELAVEAIKVTNEICIKQLKESLFHVSDPVAAVRSFFENFAKDFRDIEHFEGAPIGLMALETWLISEPLRKACQSAFDQWQRMLSDMLVYHGYGDAEAKELAMTIHALVEGAIVLSVTRKDHQPLLTAAKHISMLL